jgi:hypothetical protein
MKTRILLTILLCTALITHSQNLKRVSAYDNNYNSNSGIFGISDNGVYEYSWYYDSWLALPTDGLPLVAGESKIDEISTFDNNSLNPSGIYIIADTAVFVYNYYAQYWYALHNTGLCRDGDIVQLSDLSAHLETDSDDVRVYVISCDNVYYYRWYFQDWVAISNNGISTKYEYIENQGLNPEIFPNPANLSSVIRFELNEQNSGNIRIAVFNLEGEFIKEIRNQKFEPGKHEISLKSEDLAPGTYFYEIKGDKFSLSKSLIKI